MPLRGGGWGVLSMCELLASASCHIHQMRSKVGVFYQPSWDLQLSKPNPMRYSTASFESGSP